MKRFPRVLLRDGRETERLSPFSESNRKADATAFAALMKHIREVDAAHTVIMVQVENEVGCHSRIPRPLDGSECSVRWRGSEQTNGVPGQAPR